MTKRNYMRMVRAYSDAETLNGLRHDAQNDPALDTMEKDEILGAIANKFARTNAGQPVHGRAEVPFRQDQPVATITKAAADLVRRAAKGREPKWLKKVLPILCALCALCVSHAFANQFADSSPDCPALVPTAISAPDGSLSLLFVRRLAALSMVESGDNDNAVGRAGEVSRFQVRPDVWHAYASRRGVTLDPRNAFTAWNIAGFIMHDRCNAFETKFHRQPTDQEFYVLWARPLWLLSSRPICRCAAMTARAQRFANLCQ